MLFRFPGNTYSQAEAITLVGEDSWYPCSAVKDGQNRGFAVDVVRVAYAAVNIDVKFIVAGRCQCQAQAVFWTGSLTCLTYKAAPENLQLQ